MRGCPSLEKGQERLNRDSASTKLKDVLSDDEDEKLRKKEILWLSAFVGSNPTPRTDTFQKSFIKIVASNDIVCKCIENCCLQAADETQCKQKAKLPDATENFVFCMHLRCHAFP